MWLKKYSGGHKMAIRFSSVFLMATIFFISCIPANLFASNWPEKPINMIVAWAPGGVQIERRSLANILSEKLGVPVAVLNRPGANGGVGHTTLAQARPDGYTIGFITPQLVTGPILGLTTLTYKELTTLTLINNDPAAVTVKIDAPWNSLKEFIEHARKNPSKVRIGNSGPGGTWHMVAVSLERVSGAKFIHMPYPGAAPAITDLLGRHIEAVTYSAAEVAPQVQSKLLSI
jgi:tripartite-type tricarboxylate transporter receptor subunit TctC